MDMVTLYHAASRSTHEIPHKSLQRRELLGNAVGTAAAILGVVEPSNAAVTDETNTFADTWWNPNSSQPNAAAPTSSSTIPSDE